MENFRSDNDYRIQTYFETHDFKEDQKFRFRVVHIYDPTKFWIVAKYRELEVTERIIFKEYYMHRSKYEIPKDKIAINLYCCCLIDSGFYRGVIVGFPVTADIDQEVQVHFIDHGWVRVVEMKNVYYLDERFHKLPQFAIRAALAGVAPKNSNGQWSSEDVLEFRKLVDDKIFVGIVHNLCPVNHRLELQIAEEKDGKVSKTFLHEILISQNRAMLAYERVPSVASGPLKYPYLFPTHEALESGKVPVCVCDAEYVLSFSNCTKIVSRYYLTSDKSKN